MIYVFLILIVILLFFYSGGGGVEQKALKDARNYFEGNPPIVYTNENRIKLFEKSNSLFKNFIISFFISRGSELNIFNDIFQYTDKELIKSATTIFDWNQKIIKDYAKLFYGRIYYKGNLIKNALKELKADVCEEPPYDIYIIDDFGDKTIKELEKWNVEAWDLLDQKGKLFVLNFSITDCYTIMLRDINNEIIEKISGKKIKTKNYINYLYLDKIFSNFIWEESFTLTGFQEYGETINIYRKNTDKIKLHDYLELYRFSRLFKKDKTQTKYFLKYIAKRFKVSYKVLKYMARNTFNDYNIYKYIRENYTEKNFDIPVIKIDSIPVKSAKNILDVGTERIEFLEALEKKFKAEVRGINIQSGFCHYDEKFNEITNEKFQYYDGKKIPFKDKKFDLVTVFSVMHHIPNSEIPKFIKEVCRVSSQFVFVKDVNLDDENSRFFFDIQHELFEEVNMHGKSYRNSFLTFDLVEKSFNKNKFFVEKITKVPNFNKTFYVLFKKKLKGLK